MSTEQHIRLYGPSRTRVGDESREWAVWILGQDDIHEQDSLAEALEFAAEHNSIFADLRLGSTSEFDPISYAVVLHHGYAWNATVEHQLGRDCGHPDCGPCSFDRAAAFDKAAEALHCARCKQDDGPFTPAGLCEACARPMPLDGVA